jgi:hypothetical protein
MVACDARGHEVVDTVGGPAIDELAESVCEPGVRIDAVHLGCLDERSDNRPIGAAFVAAGKSAFFRLGRSAQWSVRPYWSRSRCGRPQATASAHPNG